MQQLIQRTFGVGALTAMLAAGPAALAQNEEEGAGESAAKENALEYALMETSMGDVLIELNREKAPVTVANFLKYADDDFYDNTIFHRVIATFMIQGGGFTRSMVQKPTNSPIKNEFENGLSNTRGTIAMARTSAPDSATSQFFINVVNNTPLDEPREDFGGAGYCVFGKVIAGIEVVDKIKAVSVHTVRVSGRAFPNVPVEPVIIRNIEQVTKERADALKDTLNTSGDGDDG